MPVDAICLQAVAAELRPQLLGLRVDKVQQPARDQVVLLCRGERLYISPYKESADIKFDSSLATSVSVLKPFVVPLLENLPAGKYPVAGDILRGLEKIEPLDEKYIAADSLAREFIGGSSFKY